MRRAIDPCRIQRAEIRRDGETLATVDVYHYKKASFSARLAMALSGVVSEEGALDKATLLSALPEGVMIQSDDEIAFFGSSGDEGIAPATGTGEGETPSPLVTALARVLRVELWPTHQTDALITLTLKEVEV